MGETPPNPQPHPLAVSIPFFFKPEQQTHNHKKQPLPLTTSKMASEGGRGQPGLAGGDQGRGRRKTSPVAESVLLVPAGARQGPTCPTSNTCGCGRRVGLSGRGRNRNRVLNHGSHHAVSTVGTKRERGVGTTPTCPGQGQGMAPTWGWRGREVAASKLGGGAARREAGADRCPVDSLSSAPRPSQAL